MNVTRLRWSAIGAAVAVTLGAGGIGLVSATTPTGASAFVPVEPCRVADTRPGSEIGPRSTPLAPGETLTIQAHGDNGECVDIPSSATALSLNITAVGASAQTFLTVWPNTAGTRPLASSMNPAPGQPPTPNAVSTALSADGEFNIYNDAGEVSVIVDINGFYTDHHHDDRYLTEAEVDVKVAEGGTVFDRTVVVNGGASALDNGVALTSALTEIASESPSAEDPWTVLLEPGVFEVVGAIVVPDHVTVTGSGVEATTLQTPASSSVAPMVSFGTGEMRHLEVSGSGVGYLVQSTGSFRADSLRFRFSSPNGANLAAALNLVDGQHLILDSEFLVDSVSNGIGLRTEDADVTVRGTSLTSLSGVAAELIYMNGGDVVVDHSTLEGSAIGVFSCCNSDDGTLTIRHSVIDVSGRAIFANFRPLDLRVESSTMIGVTTGDVVWLNGGGSALIRHSTVAGGSVGGTGHSEVCVATATASGFLDDTCP